MDFESLLKKNISFDYPIPNLNLFNHFNSDIFLNKNQYSGILSDDIKLKTIKLNELNLIQYLLNLENNNQPLLAAEGLLKSIEFNRSNYFAAIEQNKDLKRVNKKILTLRFSLIFINIFKKTNDLRYINTTLKVLELSKIDINNNINKNKLDELTFMTHLVKIFLNSVIKIIESKDWKNFANPPFRESILDNIQFSFKNEFENSPEVILFSPNNYGLLTLITCELLKIHGIKVKGIIIRKLFNFKRLLFELRRDGIKWVYKKVKNKLLFRNSSETYKEFLNLSDYSKEIGLTHKSLTSWGKENDTLILFCKTLNDETVQNFLKENSPRMVIFCGGGLISEKTLELSGRGVLNCHSGVLPAYRGMDTFEWALLERNYDKVGITTHFMVKGIDEGEILFVRKVKKEIINDLNKIEKFLEVEQVKLLVYSTIQLFKGKIKLFTQKKEQGKQYFYLHNTLLNILKKSLENYEIRN